jgi:hypothetical protein
MVLFERHVPVGPCAIKQRLDEVGERFVSVLCEFCQYPHAFFVIFFHHGSDPIDEDLELLDDLLVDIEILCALQSIERLVIIPILYFDLGDFVDGPSDSTLVGVELDGLFIADDGIVGLF